MYKTRVKMQGVLVTVEIYRFVDGEIDVEGVRIGLDVEMYLLPVLGFAIAVGVGVHEPPFAQARHQHVALDLMSCGAVSPGVFFSTRYPRMSPSSSLAQTRKTSAIGEFVIHVFVPLSTMTSPS